MDATGWADISVATFTGLLAAGTYSLARQTKKAVDVDARLLEIADRQAKAAEDQARLTTSVVAASDRPALTLSEGQSIFIENLGSEFKIEMTLTNYGTGAATFDPSLPDPNLMFYAGHTFSISAKADRVLILKDSSVVIRFIAEKSKGAALVPASRPNGSTPGGVLDIWYTDTSRAYSYRAVFTLDLVKRSSLMRVELIAELRLSDIRLEGPIAFVGKQGS
jgi:hypothetical protein